MYQDLSFPDVVRESKSMWNLYIQDMCGLLVQKSLSSVNTDLDLGIPARIQFTRSPVLKWVGGIRQDQSSSSHSNIENLQDDKAQHRRRSNVGRMPSVDMDL